MQENPLVDYTLHLADNALILGHRNSEWTGHGPILEQDIALSNISLDLIGQARNLYQYAARLINETDPGRQATEDTLAYLRDPPDFRNCLLVEQPNGDWGRTVLRQFFFSAYQQGLFGALQKSRDPQLAAIAEKSIKETTYHLRWSSEWVIRLGDGTPESHTRMLKAWAACLPLTEELFQPAAYESMLERQGIAAGLLSLLPSWKEEINKIATGAKIPYLPSAESIDPGAAVPAGTGIASGGGEADRSPMYNGGKQGRHTQYLVSLLAEMQVLQRTYPGCEW